LLPVANRPLLSYALDLLEASDLKDLIVVSAHSSAPLPLVRALVPTHERGVVWLMWA
jgi:dTDP-glucose pyrophosphorylase